MIKEIDVRRKGNIVLLGIATENTVLDILTSYSLLQDCLNKLLEVPQHMDPVNIGTFGIYPIRLNIHVGTDVSIFIDGPEFEKLREQSSAIWLGKEEMCQLLVKVLQEINAEV